MFVEEIFCESRMLIDEQCVRLVYPPTAEPVPERQYPRVRRHLPPPHQPMARRDDPHRLRRRRGQALPELRSFSRPGPYTARELLPRPQRDDRS